MIQKTLNAIGVTYSHMNDDVLVSSRIEAERTKQSLIVRDVFFPPYIGGSSFFCQEISKEEKSSKGEGRERSADTMAAEEAAS